jgi:dTMP kinase
MAKFIVFEGLDGSGITTQSTLLRNYLIQKESVLLTKEPTDGLIGGLIKSCLRKEWITDPATLQLLFCADRSHHLKSEILPALEKNQSVISDRYVLSTLAFGSLENKTDKLKELNKDFKKPDIVFFVDTDPKVCIERIAKSRHHIELFEEEKKLIEIRKNFISLKKHYKNTYIIDGNRTIEEIHEEIKKLMK